MEFLTLVAWIFGALSTTLLIARMLAKHNYSELHEALDAYKGYKRTFPVFYPSIVSIICWSWIITS